MKSRALLAAAVALSLVPAGTSAEVPPAGVGEVAFANSGAPQAQAAFLRGLAQLHNFQYAAAAEAFRQAQAADPGFALAFWGEAMSYNHTVWMEQDAGKARAALARLGATRADRLKKARTKRERGFLDAVEALYGEGSKEQRDFAYSAAMERLHKAYPEDVDAASFYALSLLGLAHNGRDLRLYMRSAAILEDFFQSNQRHPGVVHYLIHSYDDPTHAPLGLRAARLYAALAPDSDHAQHMTSHIFIALPDWRATIDANRRAMEVVNRTRAAAGRPRAYCGHYNEWLHYSYFQVGEGAKAEAMQAACQAAAAEELASGKRADRWGQALSYAGMRARGIVESGKAPADAPLTVDSARYPGEAMDLAYGDLLLARGRQAELGAAAQRLEAAAAAVGATDGQPANRKRREIVLLQAKGLVALAAGRSEEGIAALQAAADAEKAMEVPFGPPLVEKPSLELLGDELARLGRNAEAAEAYAAALTLAPGRRLSLAGYALASNGPPGPVATASAAPHKH